MPETDLKQTGVAGFGYAIAVATAAVTLITFAIAFNTPPLSGPGCTGDCFEYPYHGIASRFPGDYIWMYPTMLISLLFTALMACIHQYAGSDKKLFSTTGMAFAVISAAILIPNYYIQVTVVQPALLNGETEGIALITQFNAHGIFIALEEAGFILMCLALFSVVPVFSPGRGIIKVFRIVNLIALIIAVTAFVIITAIYGIMREYIFEIAIISIAWLQLIISSILLAIIFKRNIIPRK